MDVHRRLAALIPGRVKPKHGGQERTSRQEGGQTMRVHRLLLSLLMLILLTTAALPWATGAAAQQNNQCIEGRFLEYWRSQGVS